MAYFGLVTISYKRGPVLRGFFFSLTVPLQLSQVGPEFEVRSPERPCVTCVIIARLGNLGNQCLMSIKF